MTVAPETAVKIRRALGYLAGVCDHASTRDDVGFSAATASTGHELANLPERYWEWGTYALAAQLVTHHVKQAIAGNVLDVSGAAEVAVVASGPAITKDQIPIAWALEDRSQDKIILSVGPDDLDLWKLLKRIPGAYQPAGRGRVWSVPSDFAFALDGRLHGFECEEGVLERVALSVERSTRDQRLLITDRFVDVADGRLVIKFDYDEHLVEVVKQVPGRRWDAESWTVPLHRAGAELVDRLLAEHGFESTERSDGPVDAARAVEPPQKTMTMTVEGDVARISFPYCAEWVGAIKQLPGRLRKYDPDTKGWVVTLDEIAVDILLEEFSNCRVPVSDEVIELLRQSRPYSLGPA